MENFKFFFSIPNIFPSVLNPDDGGITLLAKTCNNSPFKAA